MLYTCNVHVVCRSGLLRKPSPNRSTKGVLSRNKLKLCYKHITCMLYVGQDSFRTHVLTGLLKDFCPERNESYVRKVYAVCRTGLFQNPCPNTSVDVFIRRTGLLRKPCLDRSFEGVLSQKKWKLCYIYILSTNSSCLYSAVSLTLVREQRFIRIFYYYYYVRHEF